MIGTVSKKIKTISTALIVSSLVLFGNINAASAEEFSDDQTKEIIQIFQKYFLDNPEIIREALIVLEQKNEAKRISEIKDIIISQKKIIENPKGLYVAGNPKGDVTLIKFFDYNAEWSKRSSTDLLYLIENDKNLRIVFYEAPMREQSSYTAAYAALAAVKQKKYLSLHTAFMNHPGSLDDNSIFAIAKKIGINVKKLKKDMENAEILKSIENSLSVAETLGIGGTPAYIIGDNLYLGAQDLEILRATISEIRINRVN